MAAIDPLRQLVIQSRNRLLARTALSATLAAATAASATWLFSHVFEGISVPLAFPAAFAAVASLTLQRDWLSVIDERTLVLTTDKAAGLNLVLATGQEAASRDQASGVEQLLIADARRAATSLNMGKVWPLLTRPIRVLLVTTALTCSASILLEVLQPESAPVADTARSADELRESAQELASRLKREAILRQDPVLEAIANAIEERVAKADDDTKVEELDVELAALIDQAKASFGDTPPSWLDASRNKAAGQDNTSAPTISGGPRNIVPQEGDDTFAVKLEDLESARRNRQLSIAEGSADTPEDEAENYGEITEGDNKPMSAAMSPQKVEPRQLQLAAREAVGAAADSGKGPADQAGGGSADLSGEGFAGGATTSDDMSLPQTEQESGRRIRITLPPSLEEQQAAAGATGSAGSATGQIAPQTVERRPIPAGRRDALARYFEKHAE